jgi:hypothetical protein
LEDQICDLNRGARTLIDALVGDSGTPTDGMNLAARPFIVNFSELGRQFWGPPLMLTSASSPEPSVTRRSSVNY